MGLFNNFNRRNHSENGTESSNLDSTKEQGNLDIPEKIFIEKDVPENNSPRDVIAPDSIENNIDLLFKFLDRNHEQQGYNDALINPDSSHLEQNIEALKNELGRTIKKVSTFYEDFIKEINYHIDSRSRSGMVDTVEELKMKKEIAEGHIQKIMVIENDAKNNTGDSQGIILSYTRGFKNGLAAISHHSILRKKF
jgi:hypothetical protein